MKYIGNLWVTQKLNILEDTKIKIAGSNDKFPKYEITGKYILNGIRILATR